MYKHPIGAASAQPPVLTLVASQAGPAPIGFVGQAPCDLDVGHTRPQPFAMLITPGTPGEQVVDPLASTVGAYLDVLQGTNDAGLAHGTLALANGLGISEDRWVVACAKLEAAGALVRTQSRLDRRSLIHTVVNPVRTVPGISWVRIRIGMLMDCAPGEPRGRTPRRRPPVGPDICLAGQQTVHSGPARRGARGAHVRAAALHRGNRLLSRGP